MWPCCGKCWLSLLPKFGEKRIALLTLSSAMSFIQGLHGEKRRGDGGHKIAVSLLLESASRNVLCADMVSPSAEGYTHIHMAGTNSVLSPLPNLPTDRRQSHAFAPFWGIISLEEAIL